MHGDEIFGKKDNIEIHIFFDNFLTKRLNINS